MTGCWFQYDKKFRREAKCICMILLFLTANAKANINWEKELPVIYKAAKRNGCNWNDFLLLVAIRISENGRQGCEFGVKHPKAWETNLDTQAGWAAATVKNHCSRTEADEINHEFIIDLADRYCPPEVDSEGNLNWARNVEYWYDKLKDKNEE